MDLKGLLIAQVALAPLRVSTHSRDTRYLRSVNGQVSSPDFPQQFASGIHSQPAEDLRLQFEADSRFDAEEKQAVWFLLGGMILKHEARRWSSAIATAAPAAKERTR